MTLEIYAQGVYRLGFLHITPLALGWQVLAVPLRAHLLVFNQYAGLVLLELLVTAQIRFEVGFLVQLFFVSQAI